MEFNVCASDIIKLWGVGSNFSKAFGMPNAYLVADGLEPRTIAATRPMIDPETGLETLPFVAPMIDAAKLSTKSDADKTRWPNTGRASTLQAGRPEERRDGTEWGRPLKSQGPPTTHKNT